MPAKPKRGTIPSFDGCLVDKRFTFVNQELSFPHIRTRRRTLAASGNPRVLYVCAFRTFPHIRTCTRKDTPLYMLKRY